MKYLRADSLFHAIFFIAYIFSSTLFIYSVFNELNILCINADSINYFNELDCPTELIDQTGYNIRENKLFNNDNNILLKFLKLFKGSNIITSSVLPEELKNNYYIENRSTIYDLSGNELINSSNGANNMYKYHYEFSAYLQKISSYVDTLTATLGDLKVINENISSNMK
jgi:hypothetical protein